MFHPRAQDAHTTEFFLPGSNSGAPGLGGLSPSCPSHRYATGCNEVASYDTTNEDSLPDQDRLTNKAYLSAVTMTNISRSFFTYKTAAKMN